MPQQNYQGSIGSPRHGSVSPLSFDFTALEGAALANTLRGQEAFGGAATRNSLAIGQARRAEEELGLSFSRHELEKERHALAAEQARRAMELDEILKPFKVKEANFRIMKMGQELNLNALRLDAARDASVRQMASQNGAVAGWQYALQNPEARGLPPELADQEGVSVDYLNAFNASFASARQSQADTQEQIFNQAIVAEDRETSAAMAKYGYSQQDRSNPEIVAQFNQSQTIGAIRASSAGVLTDDGQPYDPLQDATIAEILGDDMNYRSIGPVRRAKLLPHAEASIIAHIQSVKARQAQREKMEVKSLGGARGKSGTDQELIELRRRADALTKELDSPSLLPEARRRKEAERSRLYNEIWGVINPERQQQEPTLPPSLADRTRDRLSGATADGLPMPPPRQQAAIVQRLRQAPEGEEDQVLSEVYSELGNSGFSASWLTDLVEKRRGKRPSAASTNEPPAPPAPAPAPQASSKRLGVQRMEERLYAYEERNPGVLQTLEPYLRRGARPSEVPEELRDAYREVNQLRLENPLVSVADWVASNVHNTLNQGSSAGSRAERWLAGWVRRTNTPGPATTRARAGEAAQRVLQDVDAGRVPTTAVR